MKFVRVIALAFSLVCAACTTEESCEVDTLICVLTGFEKDTHDDLHSVIVIQNGETLAEKYYSGGDSKTLVDVRSAGKSVTSLLFGIAVDKKLIESTNERVAKYLPEASNSAVGVVRFEHLLTMRTGLDADSNYPGSVGIEDNMDLPRLFMHQLKGDRKHI